jgi:DNA replication protein DnaC
MIVNISLATWFTTNFTASELVKRFGNSSNGNAIIDRLFEICQYVPIEGESFRKRKG